MPCFEFSAVPSTSLIIKALDRCLLINELNEEKRVRQFEELGALKALPNLLDFQPMIFFITIIYT